jgi:hypothetical protein
VPLNRRNFEQLTSVEAGVSVVSPTLCQSTAGTPTKPASRQPGQLFGFRIHTAGTGFLFDSTNNAIDSRCCHYEIANTPIAGGIIKYSDPACHTLQALGTEGNVRRNSIYGPVFSMWTPQSYSLPRSRKIWTMSPAPSFSMLSIAPISASINQFVSYRPDRWPIHVTGNSAPPNSIFD